jgi:putative nucleotidyltransferase with HDIG domain
MNRFLRNLSWRPFRRAGVRRRELRRAHNGQAGAAGRLFRREIIGPSILLGLFAVAAGLVILYGQTSLAYRSGQRLDRPIVARVDFTWDNPIKAAREQDVARRGTPNYYRLNSELIAEVEKDLQALTQALAESPSYEEFQARIKGAARPARGGGATASSGWNFSESAYEQLHRLASEQGEQWRAICGELTRTLASAPVIWSTPAEQRQPKSLVLEPVVFDPTSPDQRKRFLTYVYDLGSRGQMDDAVRAILAGLPPSLNEDVRKGFREYLVGLFAPHGLSGPMRAVYVYDAVETQQRMELAAKAVSPTEAYTRGQTLVQADSTITETMLDLLRAERAAYTEKLRTDPVLHHGYVLHQIGLCGVVLATVLALAVYTLGYRPQVLRSLVQTSELLLVLLAGVVICRWIATSNLAYADRWAIVPVWLIGSMLAIGTQQRYAIGVTFAAALLAVLALRTPLVGEYVLLVGTTLVAIAMLGDIRTRTKLVMVGVAAGLAAFALSVSGDLAMMQPAGYAVTNALAAASAALGASLLLHGLLPLVERFFGIVTGMTLLEWCDINKPLLRRLAREAPGTYNHALVLGSMAEAAAESIGAQGLLTRVGAYYHDIGKVNKPRYFVENLQSGGANWHDRLAPTMSLLIILGHVKDGLELAREYGLPRVLWPFITEHHGTTLVRYFYRQAAQRQNGNQTVAESDFRYPGPKPHSRESAILMIADSVESAVRTLSEPTPGRIEGLVHQMVMDRLADGQFEECDITLRELHKVEESIVKSLCAIYHGRIVYPSAKEPGSGTTARPKAVQSA